MNGDVSADSERELMGAYLLGLLDTQEARAVETRLAADAGYRREMEELREMTELLGEVPPEALLDGPPDGDLVLQRTLRQIRAEGAAQRRRRTAGLVAVAAVAVGVVLGGGVMVGRATAPSETVIAQGPAQPPQGGRVLEGRDGDVRMTVTLTPAAGWVRLAANVAGLPKGERCNLVVVGRDGARRIAAGWVVSAAGERGVMLNGSASIPPDQVAAVVVENEAGHEFVTLRA